MIDVKHYVPILRLKQAEMFALRDLYKTDKERITPLIEVVPKPFLPPAAGSKKNRTPDPSKVLEEQAKDILAAQANAPFFLDLQHIDGVVELQDPTTHPLGYLAKV